MPRYDLETFYKGTHIACRYVMRWPSPRLIREPVEAWRVFNRTGGSPSKTLHRQKLLAISERYRVNRVCTAALANSRISRIVAYPDIVGNRFTQTDIKITHTPLMAYP